MDFNRYKWDNDHQFQGNKMDNEIIRQKDFLQYQLRIFYGLTYNKTLIKLCSSKYIFTKDPLNWITTISSKQCFVKKVMSSKTKISNSILILRWNDDKTLSNY